MKASLAEVATRALALTAATAEVAVPIVAKPVKLTVASWVLPFTVSDLTLSAEKVSEVILVLPLIATTAPLAAVETAVVWSIVRVSKSKLVLTSTSPIVAPVTTSEVKSPFPVTVNAPFAKSAETVKVSRLAWDTAETEATSPEIVAVVKSWETNAIAGPVWAASAVAVRAATLVASVSLAPSIVAVTRSAARAISTSTASVIDKVSTPAKTTVSPVNPETVKLAVFFAVIVPSEIVVNVWEAGPSIEIANVDPAAVPAAVKSSSALRSITPPTLTCKSKFPL